MFGWCQYQLLDPGGLLHRNVNAVTSTFITRVGEHWHGIAEFGPAARPGTFSSAARSCTLPGSTSETHSGIRTGRTAPGCSRRNRASSPRTTSRSSSPCGSWFSCTGRRPRDLAGPATRYGTPSASARSAAPAAPDAGRQHLDHLIEVSGTRWTAERKLAAQPRDVARRRTRPGRRPPAYSSPAAVSLTRAHLVGAASSWETKPSSSRHVEHDSIGDHAEPLPG